MIKAAEKLRRQQWIAVWGWIGWLAEKDLMLADLFERVDHFDRQLPRPRSRCKRLV